MPRKTRAAIKAEATAEQDASIFQSDTPQETPATETATRASRRSSGKGKGKEAASQGEEEAHSEAEQEAPTEVGPDEAETDAGVTAAQASGSKETTPRLTMEQRKEKMMALKKKMAQSTQANRNDLFLDKQAQAKPQRDATNSRKLAKAEAALDERDALERGEDWERQKNWQYSIEDGERWEAKQANMEEKKDKGLIDPNGLAARSYQRKIRGMKPDLASYAKQSASSSRSEPSSSSSSSAVALRGPTDGGAAAGQVVRRKDAYAGLGDKNSLSYGAHRPNEEAVERMVSHLNMEKDLRDKRSRKRPTGDDGEVTYINEKNKNFNRKIGRYFDEYTKEIRENFERGTAL